MHKQSTDSGAQMTFYVYSLAELKRIVSLVKKIPYTWKIATRAQSQ